MKELVEDINAVFTDHGFALTFKDVCRMFYEQGYIDTFGEGFEEYYNNLFDEEQ